MTRYKMSSQSLVVIHSLPSERGLKLPAWPGKCQPYSAESVRATPH